MSQANFPEFRSKMAGKALSQGTLKTNYGLNNQPIFPKVSREA